MEFVRLLCQCCHSLHQNADDKELLSSANLYRTADPRLQLDDCEAMVSLAKTATKYRLPTKRKRFIRIPCFHQQVVVTRPKRPSTQQTL